MFATFLRTNITKLVHITRAKQGWEEGMVQSDLTIKVSMTPPTKKVSRFSISNLKKCDLKVVINGPSLSHNDAILTQGRNLKWVTTLFNIIRLRLYHGKWYQKKIHNVHFLISLYLFFEPLLEVLTVNIYLV
jgi:hypothetical protein